MTQAPGREGDDESLTGLVPLVRRVVASRVREPHTVEDIVQETLTRVTAARPRVDPAALRPYAVVTAKNLVARHARINDVARRKAHPLLAQETQEAPDAGLVRDEDSRVLLRALQRLTVDERDLLMAHEVDGVEVRALADGQQSTPGAVAARLHRTRAKLRVEFLLAQENADAAGPRCRPVLRALSLADRRRQDELDATGHLLECDLCSHIGTLLLERRGGNEEPSAVEVAIAICVDADVVTARQRGRDVALDLGFDTTSATLLATAISEIARNVVKFAVRGEVRVFAVNEEGRDGVTVVVRDAGPGIPDVDLAMRDGYSTYQGLGLGLPGTRRLMDRFDVVTQAGKGTTVTMTEWRTAGTTTTAGDEHRRTGSEAT